jgi:hypothetical protein
MRQPPALVLRASRRLVPLLMAAALMPAALLTEAPGRRLFGIARAQAAEAVTIERIEVPDTGGSVTLTGLVITGSTLPQAEIETLLKAGSIALFIERLERLTAERIAIARVEWRTTLPGQEALTVYDGIEATGITAGLIARVTLAGGRQTRQMKAGDVAMEAESTFGKLTVDTLDVAGIFRWIYSADPAGAAPMKPLHGRYDLERMDIRMGETRIHLGRITADGLTARLARQAPAERMAQIGTRGASPDAPEAGLRALAAFVDLYPVFAFGGMEIEGMDLAGKDQRFGVPFSGSVGKISFGRAETPVLTVRDLDFRMKDPEGREDGTLRLKTFAVKGDLYRLITVGLREGLAFAAGSREGQLRTPEARQADAALREIVAAAGRDLTIGDVGVTFEGFDVDFPPAVDAANRPQGKPAAEAGKSGGMKITGEKVAPGKTTGEKTTSEKITAEKFKSGKETGGKDTAGKETGTRNAPTGERAKLRLDSFGATFAGFVNLVPTRIDLALGHLAVPLPAQTADEGVAALRSLGIETVDLSARIKAGWDEATSRFLIEDVMADMGRFGKLGLKGELGNIPRALFENPGQNWPVALMGGNARSVSLALENKGGFEAILAQSAAEQKKTPEALKLELSGLAPLLIGSMMGGHPDAGPLADALAKFIRTPGVLHLTVRASGPAGLTVMDVAAGQSKPSVVLDKLRFEATAQ